MKTVEGRTWDAEVKNEATNTSSYTIDRWYYRD